MDIRTTLTLNGSSYDVDLFDQCFYRLVDGEEISYRTILPMATCMCRWRLLMTISS